MEVIIQNRTVTEAHDPTTECTLRHTATHNRRGTACTASVHAHRVTQTLLVLFQKRSQYGSSWTRHREVLLLYLTLFVVTIARTVGLAGGAHPLPPNRGLWPMAPFPGAMRELGSPLGSSSEDIYFFLLYFIECV